MVFDASAVIALLRDEAGSAVIAEYAGNGLISAVNLQEVLKTLILQGFDLEVAQRMVDGLHLDVLPHAASDAQAAAALALATRSIGSGLGDRSCMALAIATGLPALTTDRDWRKLQIAGLSVIVAR